MMFFFLKACIKASAESLWCSVFGDLRLSSLPAYRDSTTSRAFSEAALPLARLRRVRPPGGGDRRAVPSRPFSLAADPCAAGDPRRLLRGVVKDEPD
ncbi:hypothetical protein GUJ93_ZPchr0010g10835 [Zizania palustris]|uniref:Uncharacterized protein n=1 Tax=Zizania palustris TaxID=103762 RepID=A0A8J6BB60_ZIZPA|nr:hypothetical protein GUJ93_ZPchr0010g10835 [Zizania palustris]